MLIPVYVVNQRHTTSLDIDGLLGHVVVVGARGQSEKAAPILDHTIEIILPIQQTVSMPSTEMLTLRTLQLAIETLIDINALAQDLLIVKTVPHTGILVREEMI